MIRAALRWLWDHPRKAGLLAAGIAFLFAALAFYVVISGVFEYALCLNERRHFPTNFAQHENDIREECHRLHLWFLPGPRSS